MSYLARLRALASEKTNGEEPTKPTKAPFDGFVGSRRGAVVPGTTEARVLPILRSGDPDAEEPKERARATVRPDPLTPAESAALARLAVVWGMDAEDQAVMFRQCDCGGNLADGSTISPEEARRFWLAEAGTVQ